MNRDCAALHDRKGPVGGEVKGGVEEAKGTELNVPDHPTVRQIAGRVGGKEMKRGRG